MFYVPHEINQKMKNPDLSIKYLCHFCIFHIYLFWLFFWYICILAFIQHFNKFFFVTYRPLLASAVLKPLARFTLLIKKGFISFIWKRNFFKWKFNMHSYILWSARVLMTLKRSWVCKLCCVCSSSFVLRCLSTLFLKRIVKSLQGSYFQ